jgi:hypothetical protein
MRNTAKISPSAEMDGFEVRTRAVVALGQLGEKVSRY